MLGSNEGFHRVGRASRDTGRLAQYVWASVIPFPLGTGPREGLETGGASLVASGARRVVPSAWREARLFCCLFPSQDVHSTGSQGWMAGSACLLPTLSWNVILAEGPSHYLAPPIHSPPTLLVLESLSGPPSKPYNNTLCHLRFVWNRTRNVKDNTQDPIPP